MNQCWFTEENRTDNFQVWLFSVVVVIFKALAIGSRLFFITPLGKAIMIFQSKFRTIAARTGHDNNRLQAYKYELSTIAHHP